MRDDQLEFKVGLGEQGLDRTYVYVSGLVPAQNITAEEHGHGEEMLPRSRASKDRSSVVGERASFRHCPVFQF